MDLPCEQTNGTLLNYIPVTGSGTDTDNMINDNVCHKNNNSKNDLAGFINVKIN